MSPRNEPIYGRPGIHGGGRDKPPPSNSKGDGERRDGKQNDERNIPERGSSIQGSRNRAMQVETPNGKWTCLMNMSV